MREKTSKPMLAVFSALFSIIAILVACMLGYLSSSLKNNPWATTIIETTQTAIFYPIQKTPTPTATQSSLFQSPFDFDEQDERYLFEQSKDIAELLNNVDRRLSTIEQAMLDDEDRLIEMRLLRQDIDYIRSVYIANLESMKSEIERIYTFIQWFLGAIITLALGVFGIALSNLKKSEKPDIENKVLLEKIAVLENQIHELQKKRSTVK